MAKLFEVGTRAQFDALKIKDDNVMYWLTDTQELYKGSIRYAVGKLASDMNDGLMSARDKELLDVLRGMIETASVNGINIASANVGIDEGVVIGSYENNYTTPMVMDLASIPAMADMIEAKDQIEAYSGWEIDYNYPWYDCYFDEDYSYIDANKGIKISQGQINISQESYAQFIPFEMKKTYDGIDLSDMTISLLYKNPKGQVAGGKIVNMQYNESDDIIRFAWLVDGAVTQEIGNLQIEIQARGYIYAKDSNEPNSYIWKSRIGSGISVIQSLQINEEDRVEINDDWLNDLIEQISEKVATDIAEKQIAAEVIKAQTAAVDAARYAQEAKDARDEAQDLVGTSLDNINERFGNLENIVEQQDDKIVEIENKLESDIPTKVSELENDVGYLTEHQSLENYALKTEIPTDYVSEQDLENKNYATEEFVEEAVKQVDISKDLENYVQKTEITDMATQTWVVENYPDTTEMETAISEAIENADIEGKLGNYAKTEYVDGVKNELESKISTNTTNIETNTKNIASHTIDIKSLSEAVEQIQNDIVNLPTGGGQTYTYDVDYNSEETGENVFVLYEIQNEGQGEAEVREKKKSFTIVGGSGGGTSSSLKIEYITKTPVVATLSDKVELYYKFSGTDSSGDAVPEGVATW